MKKFLISLLITAAMTGPAAAADYTMRLSHQYPPAHQVARALDQFAADVKATTGGKVDVQIFGAEQLFKATQNHAAVARGQIESAAILNIQWGTTIPEMSVASIPYLMTHVKQLQAFPTSEAAALLNKKIEERGVKPIAWMVDTNDGLFTSNKVALVKPEDFKGVKIRGLNKLFDAGLAAMGASPQAMPGTEVYQALQTGVIDAGFTGVAAGYVRRYYEVQKFGVASAIITAYSNIIVNPGWWAKLPEGERTAILAAAAKAEATLLPKADGVAPADIKNLRDSGMDTIVLTPEQEAVMAAAMQPAVIKAFEASTPDGVKLIELVKKL